MPKNPCFTISVANQKGGEGKTTTAVNLAFGLAKKGQKTLLVDMDPQANTTGIFTDPSSLSYSIFNVINKTANIDTAVIETGQENLSILPSSINLAEMESMSSNVDAPYILRDILHNLKKFNFIVIDCPPSLSICTISALVASTHVVIPAQAEKFSVDGMTGLQNTINSIKRRINPDLEVLGALITRLKQKTILSKTILPVISQFFPVFSSTISEGISIGESHLAKKSIYDYSPSARQAKEYKTFVEEALNELKS